MNITLPVWNGSVSPVFDASRCWRTFIVDASKNVTESGDIDVNDVDFSQRIRLLENQKTDILICGAVSELFAQMIIAAGIEVVPFVTGSIDDVLQAYLEDRLIDEEYMLPGCFSGGRRRRRRRGRGAL